MLIENNPYPQDTRVRSEATALLSFGCRVSVIAPSASRQPSRESVGGVDAYRFKAPFEAHGFWGYVWEYLYSTIAMFVLSIVVWRRARFDVIHAANPSDTLIFVAALYKLLGVRFVFDHHDLSAELYDANCGGRGSRLVRNVLLQLERLSCSQADAVIATNESYKRLEISRDGVEASRITVVRNGPELQRFDNITPERPAEAEGRSLIAYVGSIGRHDGLEYLLRAIHHLAYIREREDVLCIVIGKGEALPDLQRLAATLQLESLVRFTGWVSEETKLALLAAADICVDPDPLNPFNDVSTMIKVAEYMALSKPVVGFDLTENRFTAGEAGLFVKPNDVAALAEGIAVLMDNAEQRRIMGACGRRRVESELAWSHSIGNLLTVYRRLLPDAELPVPNTAALASAAHRRSYV